MRICNPLAGPSLALGVFIAATGPGGAAPDLIPEVNATAKLLAGIEAPGERRITGSRTWRTHEKAMSQAWSRHERSTLEPMSAWSRRQVQPHTRRGGVVRYAFSGPDLLHVLRMFPDAGTYVLCGLEPVGSAPRPDILEGRGAATALAEIRKILEDSIGFSFFITKDMRAELATARYGGTLPIMCLFLARSGYEITAVEFIALRQDGRLTGLGSDRKTADAVRIDARSRQGGAKTFYYFRTNIADGSIAKSGFLAHLESLPRGGSYVKAASYLMHNSYFSRIRDHLLESSEVLVQDDSGIPLRHFDRDHWKLDFFGAYTAPIPLFSERYQADLRQAFRTQAKPLPFGTGYQWRKGTSNLMVATSGSLRRAPRAVAVAREVRPAIPRAAPPAASARREGHLSTDASMELTLRLVAASELEDRAAVGGGSAFVLNEYEVLAVHSGPAKFRGERIRVVSTALLHGRRLPQRPLGSSITIRVVPLATYPALVKWHLEDDLPKARGARIYIAAQS